MPPSLGHLYYCSYFNKYIQEIFFLIFVIITELLTSRLEVLPSALRQEKEIEGSNPYWKEEVKLCLFTDDTIMDVENLRKSTEKLLERINLARWQYYIKSIIFLHISSNQKLKFLRQYHLQECQNMKYLWILGDKPQNTSPKHIYWKL